MPVNMSKRVNSLTPRQREVVRLTSLGYTNHEIAAILDLAESTVDNHRTAAMRRLGIEKATILTRIAIKHRISPLDDELSRAEKRRLAKR